MADFKVNTIPMSELPSLYRDVARLIVRGLAPAVLIMLLFLAAMHMLATKAHPVVAITSVVVALFLQVMVIPPLLARLFFKVEGSISPPSLTRWFGEMFRQIFADKMAVALRAILICVGSLFILFLHFVDLPGHDRPHAGDIGHLMRSGLSSALFMTGLSPFLGILAGFLRIHRGSSPEQATSGEKECEFRNLPLMASCLGLTFALTCPFLILDGDVPVLATYATIATGTLIYSALYVVIYLRVFEDRGIRRKAKKTVHQPWWASLWPPLTQPGH